MVGGGGRGFRGNDISIVKINSVILVIRIGIRGKAYRNHNTTDYEL